MLLKNWVTSAIMLCDIVATDCLEEAGVDDRYIDDIDAIAGYSAQVLNKRRTVSRGVFKRLVW